MFGTSHLSRSTSDTGLDIWPVFGHSGQLVSTMALHAWTLLWEVEQGSLDETGGQPKQSGASSCFSFNKHTQRNGGNKKKRTQDKRYCRKVNPKLEKNINETLHSDRIHLSIKTNVFPRTISRFVKLPLTPSGLWLYTDMYVTSYKYPAILLSASIVVNMSTIVNILYECPYSKQFFIWPVKELIFLSDWNYWSQLFISFPCK